MILLAADGALVTKEELLNGVWPGTVVSEENLKVQVWQLRKALGPDRDLIRTEFGRGYRFIGVVRSNASGEAHERLAQTKPSFSPAVWHQNCLYARKCQLDRAPSAQGSPISPDRG